MLQWKEVKPDVTIHPLSHLLRNLDCVRAMQIVCKSLREPAIFMLRSCLDEMLTHTKMARSELGGLLVGRIYRIPYRVPHRYPYVSIILSAVRSEEFRNSPVSLRMEAEVWSRSGSYMDVDTAIAGWYHSHPGIGPFFSGTDRSTQDAFFNNAYSLGIVVDPVVMEWKCYAGPDSAEIPSGFEILENPLPSGTVSES